MHVIVNCSCLNNFSPIVAKYTNILQHETANRRPTAIQVCVLSDIFISENITRCLVYIHNYFVLVLQMLRSALLKSSRVQQRIFVTEQWHVQPIDKKVGRRIGKEPTIVLHIFQVFTPLL